MRIKPRNTQAWMVDIQERLLPVMSRPEHLMERTEILLKGLRLLEVPVVVSQQYTKGLGMTDRRLLAAAGTESYLEKISFSCLGETGMREQLKSDPERVNVLVFGIETHICVLQTVLDLKEAGYQSVVVADCLDSRNPFDREIALRRMEEEGARLTTVEACLFELTERAGTDVFRQISRLIK